MKYFELRFRIEPCSETAADVLSGTLGDIGFESFAECEGGVLGYVQQTAFDERALKACIGDFPMTGVNISYSVASPEDKDWNEEWEKNYFKPVLIGGRCVVRSTFHDDYPKAEYEILINPRMAFGTGHHATTASIIGILLDADLRGKTVLDMGCGTSVLSILASKRGAKAVTAIDIDEWSVRNSRDNIALNGINNINVEHGDASLLRSREPFDIVIANINRNILLADMDSYAAVMHEGSEIYLSGFYVSDVAAIRAKGESAGLTYVDYRETDNWAAVRMKLSTIYDLPFAHLLHPAKQ